MPVWKKPNLQTAITPESCNPTGNTYK